MYSDTELVEKSKRNDLSAFEELICRHERKIYNLAYRMMGNPEDARDFAQEAFLRAFRALEGFRGESSFATWLCRIVANLCHDELRKRYHLSYESLDEMVCLTGGEVKKQVPSPDPGPAEIYEKREWQQRIQDLLMTLSPEFRWAIVLRDIEGFSYREIALQMGCSLGTVKSRISRGRDYLKEKLLILQEQNLSSTSLNKVEGGDVNGM